VSSQCNAHIMPFRQNGGRLPIYATTPPKWDKLKPTHSQMVVCRSWLVADGIYRFGADSFSHLDFDTFAGFVQASDDVDEAGEVVTLVQYRDQTHAK